jgi:3',5'-cyclic AMP phosphodiesterase CpdA
VAVCPGNHDVRFSDQPWEKGREITYAPDEAARPYAAFYSEMFYLPPNPFLSCGRRFLLGGAVPVEVVCLNSSLLGQVPDVFQGHGFVGHDQMADAAQQMGWIAGSTEPRAVRIVVVHHHLLPVTYREQPMAERSYSTSLDAEALLRWLVEHRVQVVLHGHMHSPFHTTLERPERLTGERHRVHVFGMGSSGVEVSHLGEDRKHLFGVLRLSREHLRMTYYSVDPTIDKAGEFAVIDVDL